MIPASAIRQVRKMRAAGYTLADIARQAGLTYWEVRKIAASEGTSRTHEEAVRELRRAGYDERVIAANFGDVK